MSSFYYRKKSPLKLLSSAHQKKLFRVFSDEDFRLSFFDNLLLLKSIEKLLQQVNCESVFHISEVLFIEDLFKCTFGSKYALKRRIDTIIAAECILSLKQIGLFSDVLKEIELSNTSVKYEDILEENKHREGDSEVKFEVNLIGYDPINSEGDLIPSMRMKINFNLRFLFFMLKESFSVLSDKFLLMNEFTSFLLDRFNLYYYIDKFCEFMYYPN